MKLFKKYVVLLIASLGIITACKDDSLVIVPEWESAVHGFAKVTSTNKDWLYNDPNVDIDMDLKWISIDNKLTVQKIEVYVLFDEAYVDSEGNPKVASHGGTEGKLLTSFEGSAVPANRTALNLSVTQNAVYDLYKTAKFDYDNGNGEVDVFTNPAKPQRNATQHFMWDDAITVRWEYTTEDGRVFKKWGPSVCTEFPGANCQVGIAVVCASEIFAPVGDWKFDLQDTYGDGWQGGYISVLVNGVEAHKVFINSQYDAGSVAPYNAVTKIISIPAGTTSLKFAWSNDDYNSECVFKITSPKGNVVANVATPSAGPIKLNLCLE
jgi:hypothetical protein